MASWQSVALRWGLAGFSYALDRIPLEWMRHARAGSGAAAAQRAGVAHGEASADGVPVEWFTPPGVTDGPVILYLHGGGWVLGLSVAHYAFLARLSRRLNWRVLAVDYRLAPEHPFPAGLDDCLSAYRWLRANGQPAQSIIVAGDSAGGNFTLALLLALKAAGEPFPAAGLGLSPAMDLTWPIPPGLRDPMLPSRFAQRLMDSYLRGVDPANPLVSPGLGDLTGLPPVLIQIGGIELLRASVTACAERARAAGAALTLETYPGMWHVWQLFTPFLPEAEAAIASLCQFARQHVSGERAAARPA